MHVTTEQIKRLAKLAKLGFDDDRLAELAKEMESIIAFADEIKTALDGFETQEGSDMTARAEADKIARAEAEGEESDGQGGFPISGVPPVQYDQLRDDVAGESLSAEEVTSNSAQTENGYFKVRRVVR